MSGCAIKFAKERCVALASGGAWFPDHRALVVSDLHLGKSERMARRGGAMLPPYESADTLARLTQDVAALDPVRIICLGDSFDDDAAADALDAESRTAISRLQDGRVWTWISGNHDPAPSRFGGNVAEEVGLGRLVLRHIAQEDAGKGGGAPAGEVSGHYHPKARLALRGRGVSRPCFLFDAARLILPAYGTYTGGLDWCAPVLARLLPQRAFAVLTGPAPCMVPRPALRAARVAAP